MLSPMIRMSHGSARFPLIATLVAVIFSGCGASDPEESSDSDGPAASNTETVRMNGTPSDSNAGAPSDSDESRSNTETERSDGEPGDSDTEQTPAGTDVAPVQQGPSAVSLGAAAGFTILASSTVTCTNASAVTGDVGVSPGIAITGFDASCTLSGALHAQDAAAAAAHADLLVAFDELGAAECGEDLTGVELGGLTLAPGVYCFDTTAGLTGALTLDAGGDANASWIFQVGSAITTGPGSAMAMAGGGNACNVFWKVGTSAVLGTTSSFKGNVMASASVTLTSGSSLEGRALALNAAVTSDNNAVSNCAR
jgi:hypothetical protein